ncbi:MAG: DUF6176 family protein [Candidatus Kapaibacterium sp.]
MKIELSRIRIKDGKSARVDEWLATLNARKAECIETLEREKVFVESIFRHKDGEEEFIYWFIVQGDDAPTLESSPFPIDAIHWAFAEECLDRSYPRFDIDAEVALFAPQILEIVQK